VTYSDDMLMAYADGELDAAERDAIEQAMRSDPAVAAAVARHQALRRDVFDAFAGILHEPVPERLQSQPVSLPANVVPMAAAREHRRRWSWPEWGALAATLAVGVLAGGAGWHTLQQDAAQVALAPAGGLVAQGTLARALSQDLAGVPQAGVTMGVSFVSKEGGYCRSFTMDSAAGLACRRGADWRLAVLAEGQAAAGAPYRQAAAALPPAVLDAIDERIAGDPLDGPAERAARGRGWTR
jgi:hypothetical protein